MEPPRAVKMTVSRIGAAKGDSDDGFKQKHGNSSGGRQQFHELEPPRAIKITVSRIGAAMGDKDDSFTKNMGTV